MHPSPRSPDSDERASWPHGARDLAEQLQRRLVIGEREWHALKAQRPRRAAEQLASALVVLLTAEAPTGSRGGEGREQAIALVEHALGWLKAEISDPGCPSHGR